MRGIVDKLELIFTQCDSNMGEGVRHSKVRHSVIRGVSGLTRCDFTLKRKKQLGVIYNQQKVNLKNMYFYSCCNRFSFSL